jgi:hypothetical protein
MITWLDTMLYGCLGLGTVVGFTSIVIASVEMLIYDLRRGDK